MAGNPGGHCEVSCRNKVDGLASPHVYEQFAIILNLGHEDDVAVLLYCIRTRRSNHCAGDGWYRLVSLLTCA
jgi:hypothetical protein